MADIVFDKAAFTRQLAARSDAAQTAKPPLVEELRTAAAQQVEAIDYPDRKQEAWRYTPVSGLLGHAFEFLAPFEALQVEDLDELRIEGLDAWRAVLVNGRFCAELSELNDLPAGAQLLSLRDAVVEADSEMQAMLRAGAQAGDDLFAAMNLAGLDDGLVLRIGDGVLLDKPIEILHVSIGSDQPSIAQPRILIRVGNAAGVSVIERYVSIGPALYFNNVVVDVETLPGASLNHIRVQTESDQAYQVARQTLRQAKESRYSLRSVVLGGAWSRFTVDCELNGERASADLKGLYLVNGRRFTDQHLKICHKVPHCQSSEDFRGILNGAGRAVFDGNIVVERDAQKTDARLSNDNLMLSRNAEVDTKPQLEIYADDVKCSHGTTVGELDHNALFYLRSRGIGVDQAKRILCRGFAQDLFDDVEPQALLRYLVERIDHRLTEPEEQ